MHGNSRHRHGTHCDCYECKPRHIDKCSSGSITEDNCSCKTVCHTPEPCIPPPPPTPVVPAPCPTPTPKMTLEQLILLIESKCDKENCELIVTEIETINEKLTEIKDVVDPNADPTAYQLIINMISTFEGDLTGKYPSAELVLTELQKLWECMYTRHKHYGEWSENTKTANVNSDDNCIMEDNIIAPVEVQIPVDTGDTVNHNGCVWVSLIDNNVTEPTEATEDQKLWLCLTKVDERLDDVEECCKKLHTDLFPIGAKSTGLRVLGSKVINISNTTPVETSNDGTYTDKSYETFSGSVSFTATEYPLIAKVGIPFQVRLDSVASVASNLRLTTPKPIVAEKFNININNATQIDNFEDEFNITHSTDSDNYTSNTHPSIFEGVTDGNSITISVQHVVGIRLANGDTISTDGIVAIGAINVIADFRRL